MSPRFKTRFALALVSVAALALGYVLPRAGRQGGDMLDAIAAVQRRSPRFVITERVPNVNWLRTGALYWSREPKTAEAMEELCIDPGHPDERWAGVVCFKGTADTNLYIPWVVEGGHCCVRYDDFAVFGDPQTLAEVRLILAAEGFAHRTPTTAKAPGAAPR
jgi:hypothetical protein